MLYESLTELKSQGLIILNFLVHLQNCEEHLLALSCLLVNDQRDAQFLSMCLFIFSTLYVFQAHHAHHQERHIVSIQPRHCVGGHVVCRSEVRPAHDTATDSYQKLYLHSLCLLMMSTMCLEHVES